MNLVRASGIATALAAIFAVLAPAAAMAGQPAGFRLPYADPNQAGQLTLCDVHLRPVTHGSITAQPFVWRVVSGVPAPQGYFIKGAKAQLFAYQPRPYTPAGAWSGVVMAAASLYSNRAHPMAQFTPVDEPLTYMTQSFPPIWDHLIELRLYLGAPALTEYTRTYAAADVQVTGNTWTLVSGGHASCTTGQAVSVETVVGLPGASGTPSPAHASPASANGSPAPPGSPAAATAPGAPATGTAASAHSASSPAPVIAVAVAVLAAAALTSAGLWWRRRRRATG